MTSLTFPSHFLIIFSWGRGGQNFYVECIIFSCGHSEKTSTTSRLESSFGKSYLAQVISFQAAAYKKLLFAHLPPCRIIIFYLVHLWSAIALIIFHIAAAHARIAKKNLAASKTMTAPLSPSKIKIISKKKNRILFLNNHHGRQLIQ